MAHAFNHRAEDKLGIGELLSASFPHFDAAVVLF